MIPSIDTRLASMASAVAGVIAPALGKDNPFASEQAALLVGHLQVMRAQQSITEEFEQLDYNRTRAYARELIGATDGGTESTAAAASLQEVLDAPVPFTIEQVRAGQDALAADIGTLIAAAGVDGTDEFLTRSQAIVIGQERDQSLRYRSYFSMMGYEDGSRDIPSVPEMMTEFRGAYGPGLPEVATR